MKQYCYVNKWNFAQEKTLRLPSYEDLILNEGDSNFYRATSKNILF